MTDEKINLSLGPDATTAKWVIGSLVLHDPTNGIAVVAADEVPALIRLLASDPARLWAALTPEETANLVAGLGNVLDSARTEARAPLLDLLLECRHELGTIEALTISPNGPVPGNDGMLGLLARIDAETKGA